jgi:hypothetical protein
VTHHDLEHRRADLGVARLVGLDALHHALEHAVADLGRHRRQADELQVGEAGLEDEVGGDGELDRGRREQHLVDQVAGGDGDPVVAVEEAVGPVELAIPAHQVVAEQERDLGVAQLVEAAQHRGGAPRAVAAEAAGAQVADHRRELGEGEGRGV